MQVSQVRLEGEYVCLLPLAQEHDNELRLAAADGRLWELFFTSVPSPEKTQYWIDQALALQEKGAELPFTVFNKITNKILGSTRYCNIDVPNKRLEIGYTWYAKSVQRTAINTECKLLLLSHAFEVLGCNAVEFRTDWFNKKSQTAIERLGAKRDGILRDHKILPDGRVRDTVVYSILKHEWLGVKMNLMYFLNKHRGASTES